MCPIFVGSVDNFFNRLKENKDPYLISFQSCIFVWIPNLKVKYLIVYFEDILEMLERTV